MLVVVDANGLVVAVIVLLLSTCCSRYVDGFVFLLAINFDGLILYDLPPAAPIKEECIADATVYDHTDTTTDKSIKRRRRICNTHFHG